MYPDAGFWEICLCVHVGGSSFFNCYLVVTASECFFAGNLFRTAFGIDHDNLACVIICLGEVHDLFSLVGCTQGSHAYIQLSLCQGGSQCGIIHNLDITVQLKSQIIFQGVHHIDIKPNQCGSVCVVVSKRREQCGGTEFKLYAFQRVLGASAGFFRFIGGSGRIFRWGIGSSCRLFLPEQKTVRILPLP